MGRTLLCSLGGAGAGLPVGLAVVRMAAGAQPASDTAPVIIFVGIFLAGTGAIAGAIIGDVADLLAFFRRKDQARREAQDRDKSGSGDAVANKTLHRTPPSLCWLSTTEDSIWGIRY
jgi:hypothetical protein